MVAPGKYGLGRESKRIQTVSSQIHLRALKYQDTEQQKALFMRAAELTGWSLTDFVLASAQETASRTLREHDVMILGTRDREAFVDALLNPPEPATAGGGESQAQTVGRRCDAR